MTRAERQGPQPCRTNGKNQTLTLTLSLQGEGTESEGQEDDEQPRAPPNSRLVDALSNSFHFQSIQPFAISRATTAETSE